MSEFDQSTNQLDREKLTEDIEKLQQAVSRYTNDDEQYTDSDEDVLKIRENEETNDNHEIYPEHLGMFHEGTFIPDEVTPGGVGISQDSVGSVGSIEFTNRPDICLGLNKEYQSWIQKNLTKVQLVLQHNQKCQEEINQDLQQMAIERTTYGSKRKTMTIYCKPYFKDSDGSFPPPNVDVREKRENEEFDSFVRPSKIWTVDERDKLRNAVKADRLQKALRPYMNKKEIEHGKKKQVVTGSVEEEEINARLEAINIQIKTIETRTDLIDVYGTRDDLDNIDWMKISTVDFEGHRTPEACRLFWQNAAHPIINVTKWTPSEDATLVALVTQYEGIRWEDIARELGTGRSAFMCLQRYQTKLNPCLLTGKWTPEEDEFLKEVINQERSGSYIPWSTVAFFVEGRSREQCARRYEQLFPQNFRKGKWTAQEDMKLIEATQLFGTNNWWKVKEFVPKRSAAQCRERWKNTLDENLQFGNWTYDEDKKLWLLVKELGLGHWQKIANDYLPGRTDNMCLQRYRRLERWEEEAKKRQFNKPPKLEGTENVGTRNRMRKIGPDSTASEVDNLRGRSDAGEQGANGVIANPNTPATPGVTAVYPSERQVRARVEKDQIKKDKEQGILIPRPPTHYLTVRRSIDPIKHRQIVRRNLVKRVEKNMIKEKHSPSNIQDKLRALRFRDKTGFSQILQNRLQSLKHNSPIEEAIELSSECGRELASSSSCESMVPKRGGPGRQKRDPEEVEVEEKIARLLRKKSQTRKSSNSRGLDFSSSLHHKWTKSLGARSSVSADVESKIMKLMTSALNFHRSLNIVKPGDPVSRGVPSNNASNLPVLHMIAPITETQSTPDPGLPESGQSQVAKNVKMEEPDSMNISIREDHSVIVAVTKNFKDDQMELTQPTTDATTAQNDSQVEPPAESLAGENPPETATKSKPEKVATGRRALHGKHALRMYKMPPLPPSCSTLNAFRCLLLNRKKLLTIAGKFHVPSSLPIPESLKERASTSASPVKQEKTSPVKECSSDARLSSSDQVLEEDGVTSGSTCTPVVRKRGRPKGSLSLKSAKVKRPTLVDKDLRQLRVQVVKSKLQSRRVLERINKTHDYHMLNSRFNSLFLWPSLLSTIPIEEPVFAEDEEAEQGLMSDNEAEFNEEEEEPMDASEKYPELFEEQSSDDEWEKKHAQSTSGYRKRRRRSKVRKIKIEPISDNEGLTRYSIAAVSGDDLNANQEEASSSKKVYQKRTSMPVTSTVRKSSRLAEKDEFQRQVEIVGAGGADVSTSDLNLDDVHYGVTVDDDNVAPVQPKKKRGRKKRIKVEDCDEDANVDANTETIADQSEPVEESEILRRLLSDMVKSIEDSARTVDSLQESNQETVTQASGDDLNDISEDGNKKRTAGKQSQKKQPRKVSSNVKNNSQNIRGANSSAEGEVVVRKRGRPKRIKTDESSLPIKSVETESVALVSNEDISQVESQNEISGENRFEESFTQVMVVDDEGYLRPIDDGQLRPVETNVSGFSLPCKLEYEKLEDDVSGPDRCDSSEIAVFESGNDVDDPTSMTCRPESEEISTTFYDHPESLIRLHAGLDSEADHDGMQSIELDLLNSNPVLNITAMTSTSGGDIAVVDSVTMADDSSSSVLNRNVPASNCDVIVNTNFATIDGNPTEVSEVTQEGEIDPSAVDPIQGRFSTDEVMRSSPGPSYTLQPTQLEFQCSSTNEERDFSNNIYLTAEDIMSSHCIVTFADNQGPADDATKTENVETDFGSAYLSNCPSSDSLAQSALTSMSYYPSEYLQSSVSTNFVTSPVSQNSFSTVLQSSYSASMQPTMSFAYSNAPVQNTVDQSAALQQIMLLSQQVNALQAQLVAQNQAMAAGPAVATDMKHTPQPSSVAASPSRPSSQIVPQMVGFVPPQYMIPQMQATEQPAAAPMQMMPAYMGAPGNPMQQQPQQMMQSSGYMLVPVPVMPQMNQNQMIPMLMPSGMMPSGMMPGGMMPTGMMPTGMMSGGMMSGGMMPTGMMPGGMMSYPMMQMQWPGQSMMSPVVQMPPNDPSRGTTPSLPSSNQDQHG